MNPDTELRELFLANCKKLAALTAALDMPGDEPTEKLVGLAKAMRAETTQLRAELLTIHKMACAAGLERDQLRARVAAQEQEWKAHVSTHNSALASAYDERDQLRARVDALEEDKERLDWLDRNAILRCRTLAVMERGHDDEPLRWAGVEWDGHNETIRAVIDAARKEGA
jgi:chromosome segregation ATPase